MHALMGALEANVWFEYVGTGANIADLPSRGDFALLREMGSTPVDLTLPEIAADWSQVYRDVYLAYARRRSRAEENASRDVQTEIQRIRENEAKRGRKRAVAEHPLAPTSSRPRVEI